MARQTHVLLIPSQTSVEGVNKLAQELKRAQVTIVDKDNGVVVARWDDKAKAAVAGGLSMKAFHTNKIRPADVKRLPKQAARMAELWNWSIEKSGKHVTTREVNALMAKLQLEVRGSQVYDALEKKTLGEIVSEEMEEQKGNWTVILKGGAEWMGFFGGSLKKVWARTITYVSSPPAGRFEVDFISVEIDGPRHYAYAHSHNVSEVYVEIWAWLWWGEKDGATLTGYAKEGTQARTVSGSIP